MLCKLVHTLHILVQSQQKVTKNCLWSVDLVSSLLPLNSYLKAGLCSIRRIHHYHHSHKKRKDSLEARAVLLIFSLELEISVMLCYIMYSLFKVDS